MPILLAQLEFASPGRLLVLVLLPALVYLALRGRRDVTWWQSLTSTSLRCLVFAMLCLAWAAPSCRRASDRKFVVVAVDGSASSFSDAADKTGGFLAELVLAKPDDDDVKVLTFAGAPTQIVSVDQAEITDALKYPDQTDISTAISLAQAACPPDRVPHIVLLTDGRQTRGDALAAAMGTDIPISVVPLQSYVAREIAVDAIQAPAKVAPGESVELAVRILARQRGTIRLQLLRDGTTVEDIELDVAAGETLWRTRTELGEGPATTYEAIVSGPTDHEENNRLSTIVLKGEPSRVLLVGEGDAAASLLQTLSRAGFKGSVIPAGDVPPSAGEIAGNDLVILVDRSASQFTPGQLAALDVYVRQGGGLIATGGEASFGAAAYELTALEKLLPVVATDQPVQQQKSLALVLVVDKSKSMEKENRLALAKEAAKKVAGVLQPRDQVGVLAFGDQSQWISRLAPLDNKEEVLARIDKLSAEGLTNMYPAVERAYLALSQADADSRHAILLTDGVPTPGDFDAVARRMAEAGITVSTISLGSGADQTILKDISRLARGNHHHVDNPDDLPSILERETRTAAAQVTDDEFAPDVFRQLPGLNLRRAPPLSGYVATRYKPGAQLLLTAGDGDPLLTWRRHGRGKAVVLTTDLAGSATPWRSWEGNVAFWKRLAAYAQRDETPGDAQLEVRLEGGRATVVLDVTQRTEAGLAHATDATATLQVRPLVNTDEAAERTFEMRQVAPGRYQASFTESPGERFVLEVSLAVASGTTRKLQRGVVIDYPQEYRLRPTDEATLRGIARVTGGTYEPQPAEVFAPDGRTVDVVQPLWPYVLMAALLLYLAEVAVRRLPRRQPAATPANQRRAA